MLGLPQSTEVRRPLPKAQLYKQLDWKPAQRDSFNGDVSRLDFVNWIAPRTVPAIAEGTEVNESTVTEIAKMKPQYFVMRDASAANDNVLDNFEQIFRHYSPDTIRKIL